ncbi:MAG TPA: hypothetical protein VIT83_03280 [Gammaproteobacteria bacterium]
MPQATFSQFVDVCLRQSRGAAARAALVSALAAGLWTEIANAGETAPAITSSTADARVLVEFPSASLSVGERKPFTVKVAPTAGQIPPSRVRGRFGMPDHGHWVGDEQGSPYSDQAMTFEGEFPMPGVYRFRIWLDYADGRETKTAVDFTVEQDKPLDPKVVP